MNKNFNSMHHGSAPPGFSSLVSRKSTFVKILYMYICSLRGLGIREAECSYIDVLTDSSCRDKSRMFAFFSTFAQNKS